MKKAIITGCLLMGMLKGAWAQSYHFSQFFSTPLLTNPAQTGNLEGPYRIASNFRSQGLSGGSAFFTGYLSAEVSPFQKKLAAGHRAGAGIYIMNDQSLNGALQTTSAALSTAYHVGLDEDGAHSIGIGLQASYHRRRLDYNRLSFENQFGPGGYDPAAPIGEPLNATSRSFFDANAGVLYSGAVNDHSFFGGVALYNILKHKENLGGEEFTMPVRYTVQAGAQLYAGTNGKVYVSLTHMGQGGARETTAGGAYGLLLGNSTGTNELNFGMWYRLKDAIIPYVGFQKEQFQVGLTYDYTVSQVKTASQVRNGYELTLIYKGIDKRELKTLVPWY